MYSMVSPSNFYGYALYVIYETFWQASTAYSKGEKSYATYLSDQVSFSLL